MSDSKHFRDRLPSRVVFLAASCHHEHGQSAAWPFAFTFRIAVTLTVTYTKGVGGKRTLRVWTDPDQLWAYLAKAARGKSPLWVVGHCVGRDLTVTGFWRALDNGVGRLTSVCIEDPPTAIAWEVSGSVVRLVDIRNYFPCSVAEMAADLGHAALPVPEWCDDDSTWGGYLACALHVQADAWGLLAAVAWPFGAGCFGATLPAMAWRIYRKHFQPRPVSRPHNPTLRAVEREAYHPAECAAYYAGRYEGPIHHCDVNSLYPWSMRHGMFPARAVGSGWQSSADEMTRRVADGPCVARVYLSTIDTTFPVKKDGRGRMATGKFWTALAGAELREALTRGLVVACRDWVHYEGAPLFVSWVTEWYGLRLAARERGKPLLERLAKLALNSVSGKWAQRTSSWVNDPAARPMMPFGTWWERSADGKERACFRAVANLRERLVDREDSRDARPAVAACITAAGREAMRSLRAVAGVENCLYQDTDSLVLRGRGYDRLGRAGLTGSDRLGAVRLQGVFGSCEVYGPKRYRLGENLTAAGLSPQAQPVAPGVYERIEVQSLPLVVARDPGAEVGFRRRWITLHPQSLETIPGTDGRVAPFRLMEV